MPEGRASHINNQHLEPCLPPYDTIISPMMQGEEFLVSANPAPALDGEVIPVPPYHVDVAVLAGEVERRLPLHGRLVWRRSRTQQYPHRLQETLPRRVVQWPHV